MVDLNLMVLFSISKLPFILISIFIGCNAVPKPCQSVYRVLQCIHSLLYLCPEFLHTYHDDLNQYFYHAIGSVATNSQSSPYVMWHISALGEHQIKRKVLCQDFTEMIFPSFFRDLTFWYCSSTLDTSAFVKLFKDTLYIMPRYAFS